VHVLLHVDELGIAQPLKTVVAYQAPPINAASSLTRCLPDEMLAPAARVSTFRPAPLDVEQGDDRVCKARELIQGGVDWLAGYGGNLAERYLDSDIDLIARIRHTRRSHVAVFQRLRSVSGVEIRGQGTKPVKRRHSRARFAIGDAAAQRRSANRERLC
jgi:hypothetical protein